LFITLNTAYYKEFKAHPEKAAACPLEKKCPHFKKDFEIKSPHPHHGTSGDDHSAAKCPHLNKKAKKEEEKVKSHDEL
jgi:hypothetical protein